MVKMNKKKGSVDRKIDEAASIVAASVIMEAADELDATPVEEAPEVTAASAVHDDVDADDLDDSDITLGAVAEKTAADATLRVKYVHDIARSIGLSRATSRSAGLDLCACKAGCQSSVKLVPGSVESIPTGVAVAIPEGYCGLVFIRSGKNVKEGLQLSGGAYVIDSDFRGEIMLPLTSNRAFGTLVQPGERVAQLVIIPVSDFPIHVVDELPQTTRGANGFGSTGK